MVIGVSYDLGSLLDVEVDEVEQQRAIEVLIREQVLEVVVHELHLGLVALTILEAG